MFRSQLAVDVTLGSALTRSGEAQPGAAEEDGAILLQARVDKENKYPELLNGRCRLVVVALETGGRWSNEAVDFIWQFAQSKAREVPSFMTHQMALVWERRWTRAQCAPCPLRGRWWSRRTQTCASPKGTCNPCLRFGPMIPGSSGP